MKLVYSEIFETAWKSIKDDLALTVGLTLVYGLGAAICSHLPVIGGVLSLPLSAGYIKCLLKVRAREKFGFEDFFWGFTNFNRFLHLMVMNLIVLIGAVIGTILLVVPGIWWFVASIFSLPAFILKEVDSVESIKTSLALVKGRWWNVFGFLICCGLLNLAGAICLMVGMLVSLPVSVLATVIAAEKLLKEPGVLNPPTMSPQQESVETPTVPQA